MVGGGVKVIGLIDGGWVGGWDGIGWRGGRRMGG